MLRFWRTLFSSSTKMEILVDLCASFGALLFLEVRDLGLSDVILLTLLCLSRSLGPPCLPARLVRLIDEMIVCPACGGPGKVLLRLSWLFRVFAFSSEVRFLPNWSFVEVTPKTMGVSCLVLLTTSLLNRELLGANFLSCTVVPCDAVSSGPSVVDCPDLSLSTTALTSGALALS